MSEHPLLSRFLKRIYNRHPHLPQYMESSEINLLLTHDLLDHNENLEYKYLS